MLPSYPLRIRLLAPMARVFLIVDLFSLFGRSTEESPLECQHAAERTVSAALNAVLSCVTCGNVDRIFCAR